MNLGMTSGPEGDASRRGSAAIRSWEIGEVRLFELMDVRLVVDPVFIDAIQMPEVPENAGFWKANIHFPPFHSHPAVAYQRSGLLQG